MTLDDFYEKNIRHFYSCGEYENVNINYIFCDDLYEKATEVSPCERFSANLNHNKKAVQTSNGLCIPFYNIDEGINILIAKKVFEMDPYTAYGTFQHETTHAHDYSLLSKFLECQTFDKLMDNENYFIAMKFISEFNARKNGFKYVREIAYKFQDTYSEKKYIEEEELKLLFKNYTNIESDYELAQFFGRMSVLDKYPECSIRDKAYDVLLTLNIFKEKEWYDKYFQAYDILNSNKDDTKIVVNTLKEIKNVLKQ